MYKASDMKELDADMFEALISASVRKYGDEFFLNLISKNASKTRFVSPSAENERLLCDRLLEYPMEARNLLFGEYCFKMSYPAIEEIFEIKNAEGNAAWFKRLLSDECGLSQDEQIGDDSLQRICEMALEKHVKQLESQSNSGEKVRSYPKKRSIIRMSLKYAAAAILICSVLFAGSLSVNAEFRARVVQWFTLEFRNYSIFYNATNKETSLEELRGYHIEYTPAKYTFTKVQELPDGVRYEYSTLDGTSLYIVMKMPDSDLAVNTENMDESLVMFEGEESFYYSGEQYNTFIFAKDGYSMYILGEVSQEECVQIAQNIKKSN